MNTVLTEELLHTLLEADTVETVSDMSCFTAPSLSDLLNQLLVEKGLRRVDVIHEARINDTFGYQIFTGQRNPSRDKVLALACALGCDVKETSRLLQAAGVNNLYPKKRRDAIILFCLSKHMVLQEIEDELYRLGEDTICS